MNYTLADVNQAIADAVASVIPGVTIYDNPNQQDTALPAVFINYRGEQPTRQGIDNRWTQTLKFDLCYLVEYNLPNMNDLYRAAADSLAYALTELQYAGGVKLSTRNHSWHVELDALHYQFDVPVRLMKPYAPNYMQTMTLEEKSK
ncbi:DUF6838 family protein [Oscillibacter sp.]|uniref:phage tail terminator family protein n=1 Tax=Oscillibacter sp. TaxID=1945593 RepID=UPI00289D8326|nr:hypothetical protein [Oscillibacter sp.]